MARKKFKQVENDSEDDQDSSVTSVNKKKAVKKTGGWRSSNKMKTLKSPTARKAERRSAAGRRTSSTENYSSVTDEDTDTIASKQAADESSSGSVSASEGERDDSASEYDDSDSELNELYEKAWAQFEILAEGHDTLHIDALRRLLNQLQLWPSARDPSSVAAAEQLVREATDASIDGLGLNFEECAALLPRVRSLMTPLSERLKTLADVDAGVALCAAASVGAIGALRKFLASGVLPSTSDYSGRTALHMAAAGGHDEVIAWLVNAGADVMAKDNFGWTAADCAMQSGRLECFNLIVRLGGAPAHFANSDISKSPFHLWREIWREIVSLSGDHYDEQSTEADRERPASGIVTKPTRSKSIRQQAEDSQVPHGTLRGVLRWLSRQGLRPAKTRAVSSNVVHQIGLGSLPLNEEMRQLAITSKIELATIEAQQRVKGSSGGNSSSGSVINGSDAATGGGSGRRRSPSFSGRLSFSSKTSTPTSASGTPAAAAPDTAADSSSSSRRAKTASPPLPKPSTGQRVSAGAERQPDSPRATTPPPPRASTPPAERERPSLRRAPSSKGSAGLSSSSGAALGSNMAQRVPYSAFRATLLSDTGLLARAASGRLAIPDWDSFCRDIEQIFEDVREDVPETKGANADYIPELAEFDPKLFALSVVTVDGQTFSCGDSGVEFPIESCSKPLTYSLVCEDLGVDMVHKFVGREPSGVAFNSFQLNKNDCPHNACINSGAMMTCSLFHRQANMAARFNKLSSGYTSLSGGIRCGFNQAVYLSEKSTAHRNFALAYFMKKANGFPTDTSFMEAVDLYFQACSIDVTCESLASMAATLANNGISPLSGQRVLDTSVVKATLNLMSSCGMYDYSGFWNTTIGLPAKSGVSGCIYLVLPGRLALCIWSPPLDDIGNSVRGIEFCKRFVEYFECSLLDIVFSRQNK